MRKEIIEKVTNLVSEYADTLHLKVILVEYIKQTDGMHLIVYIDKQEGVTLNDCVALHELIDQPIDQLDPTNGQSFILNVSSLGFDKNLNSDNLINFALGQNVDVGLFSPYNGKKHFDDFKLVSYSKQNIVLQNNVDILTIPRNKIAKITRHINF